MNAIVHSRYRNFSKADWHLYATLCTNKLTPGIFIDATDPIECFSAELLRIAEDCIPKSSPNPHFRKPWFTDQTASPYIDTVHLV